MKEYVKPNLEFIEFDNNIRMDDVGESGCNCHMDANNASMASGSSSGCEGLTGHASENPFNIKAPDWTFG